MTSSRMHYLDAIKTKLMKKIYLYVFLKI